MDIDTAMSVHDFFAILKRFFLAIKEFFDTLFDSKEDEEGGD